MSTFSTAALRLFLIVIVVGILACSAHEQASCQAPQDDYFQTPDGCAATETCKADFCSCIGVADCNFESTAHTFKTQEQCSTLHHCLRIAVSCLIHTSEKKDVRADSSCQPWADKMYKEVLAVESGFAFNKTDIYDSCKFATCMLQNATQCPLTRFDADICAFGPIVTYVDLWPIHGQDWDIVTNTHEKWRLMQTALQIDIEVQFFGHHSKVNKIKPVLVSSALTAGARVGFLYPSIHDNKLTVRINESITDQSWLVATIRQYCLNGGTDLCPKSSSSNLGLIIGIIIAIAVVGGGGGAAASYAQKKAAEAAKNAAQAALQARAPAP